MATSDSTIGLRIIKTQGLLVLIISFIIGCLFKVKTALSFGLGGISSILPGMLFATLFFRQDVTKSPKTVLKNFFSSELLKWLVTIGWLVLVFHWKDLQFLPLFLGLILTQLVYWRYLFILRH